jgi:RNA recognition motif-containing protein
MSVRLFVGNLPFRATQDDVTDLVREASLTVENTHLVTDQVTGQSRGFAFVDIVSSDEAAAIKLLDGRECLGRHVRVRRANPRSIQTIREENNNEII